MELKNAIYKVYKHLFGHTSLSDIQILLKCNKMWTADVEKYLNRVVSSSSDCSETYEPKKARKFSLSSIYRLLNELTCGGHFHPENLRICHIMDANTRYSSGALVSDTGIGAAIEVVDSLWISPF